MQVNSFNIKPIFLTSLPTFSVICPSFPYSSTISYVQLQPSNVSSDPASLGTKRFQPLNLYPTFTEKHMFSINNLTQPDYDWLKEEDLPKLEVKQEIIEKKEENLMLIEAPQPQIDLQAQKNEIRRMVTFILNNLGRVKEADLCKERETYASNALLLQLFDALIARYTSTFKTKDEILKYITRKAFTTIRNSFKQKDVTKGGLMSETLCKRYFKVSTEEIGKLGIDINHRENFLQVLFPYRKNCKNKARYKDLIGKLDSSKEFYEDYCTFLTNFAEIMRIEKEKKVTVFVPFLCDCVRRNEIQDVAYYKRIPWLDTWIKLADITAQEISVALRIKVSEDCLARKKKILENNAAGQSQEFL